MGITNIIFIIIYYEDYGINYHSLPLQGNPQPPANILSHPPAYIPAYIQTSISQQHHIFLNPKSLLIRNCHAQTTLHELVDDHVFLTSARCKWHSNPNFGAKWSEKDYVCPYLLEPVFKYLGVRLFIRHECPGCQVCEGSLACML